MDCYEITIREKEREREKSRVYLAIAKEGRRSVEKRWETLGQSIAVRLRRGKSEHLRGQTVRRTRLDRQ